MFFSRVEGGLDWRLLALAGAGLTVSVRVAAHVPRAQNSAADALCNEAIDRVMAGGRESVLVRPSS